MLRNDLYRGWIRVPSWGGSGYKGDFQALVPDRTFWIVRSRLTSGSITSTEHVRLNPTFPLRGITYCGHCGAKLTASDTTKSSGRKFPYYFCYQKGCTGVRVRKHILEAQFEQLLARTSPKPEYMPVLREVVRDVWKTKLEATASLRDGLRQRLDELRRRKDRIFDLYLTQHIGGSAYEEQTTRVEGEIESARQELAASMADDIDVDVVLSYAEEVLADPNRVLRAFSGNQRQRFLRLLFPEGVTWEGPRFRTPVTNTVFDWLRDFPEGNKKVVPPAGFEPAIFTLKG
ncbi:MAG: zinc ribbon domain-containing protein [Thermoanaerobaculia bacterium]|nr:zinc ribbon domain-containing protein [Thermoanaerobaculia bacterium]